MKTGRNDGPFSCLPVPPAYYGVLRRDNLEWPHHVVILV